MRHVYIHPNYNQITYDYNIAIIEVLGYIDFSDTIYPAVLPRSSPIYCNGKMKVIIPHNRAGLRQLKRYQTSFLRDYDCSRISGNEHSPTKTLMCFEDQCLQNLCNYVSIVVRQTISIHSFSNKNNS